jgi:hypothetical protein
MTREGPWSLRRSDFRAGEEVIKIGQESRRLKKRERRTQHGGPHTITIGETVLDGELFDTAVRRL